ncbi:MAG: hypothetical protein NVSMB19_20030 [Vulcanimicrobiaceae bacterium]
MDRPPETCDPSARTQPIPVVAAPPPRPAAAAPPASFEAAQPGPAARPAAAYVHRFGSIPIYLLARFAAFAIDIFGVGFVLATFGYHATDTGFFVVAGRDASGFATLAGGSLGIALLFAFLCEAIVGTTLGKLIFALHVRRGNGRHAGAVRVFVRYLLRPIDLVVIGPLLALLTPRHQRVGDVLSGTVVARSRIGAFASVLGIVAVVAIGYAQITFGGGITSAIGVGAETADFAPGLLAQATRLFGVPARVPARGVTLPTQTGDSVTTPAPIPSHAVQ